DERDFRASASQTFSVPLLLPSLEAVVEACNTKRQVGPVLAPSCAVIFRSVEITSLARLFHALRVRLPRQCRVVTTGEAWRFSLTRHQNFTIGCKTRVPAQQD